MCVLTRGGAQAPKNGGVWRSVHITHVHAGVLPKSVATGGWNRATGRGGSGRHSCSCFLESLKVAPSSLGLRSPAAASLGFRSPSPEGTDSCGVFHGSLPTVYFTTASWSPCSSEAPDPDPEENMRSAKGNHLQTASTHMSGERVAAIHMMATCAGLPGPG